MFFRCSFDLVRNRHSILQWEDTPEPCSQYTIPIQLRNVSAKMKKKKKEEKNYQKTIKKKKKKT